MALTPGSKETITKDVGDTKAQNDFIAVPGIKRYFNPREDYELVLLQMQLEYRRKWIENVPSPEIGLKGFDYIKTLASGNFGAVKFVKKTDDPNLLYAVKAMSKDQIVKKQQVEHVFNEKKVLQCNDFPVLLSLLFSRKDEEYVYLGMSFLCGGDLYKLHRKEKKFNEQTARFYVGQVFLAIEYLHYMSVIYRDLKPENVVIDARGFIKLTDFGFAKLVPERTMSLCGTPEYMSPEIIKSKPYRTSVDWWTFGIFLYELVNGMSPFAAYNNNVLVMYGKMCSGKFNMPGHFSEPLQHLIANLLQVDVTKRIGGDVVRNHKWFEGTDWCGLLNQNINVPHVPKVADLKDLTNFDSYNEGKIKQGGRPRHVEIFAEF